MAAVVMALDDDDPEQPYHVCFACAQRLRDRSLRPIEWFNLAALHGPYKFLLHSSYYDHDGVAEQPRDPVDSPERYPAPGLYSIHDDLERLLDYAMTRWWLEDRVIRALARHDRAEILASLRRRIDAHGNFALESTAYEICSAALGSAARDWVRERWDHWRPETLFTLCHATAGCLPFEEGYNRVVQALMDVPPQELPVQSLALAWFRSEKTLDWLEDHTDYMVNNWGHVADTWGRLAALSNLSWQRASAWLELGRPLSLVALDALKATFHYDTGLLYRFKPKLAHPAPVEEMAARLRDYAEIDPVLRVEQAVEEIIGEWSRAGGP
ncbi:MAG: hypothetical protein ACJ78Q_07935 [Chloroflexia bacterium]